MLRENFITNIYSFICNMFYEDNITVDKISNSIVDSTFWIHFDKEFYKIKINKEEFMNHWDSLSAYKRHLIRKFDNDINASLVFLYFYLLNFDFLYNNVKNFNGYVEISSENSTKLSHFKVLEEFLL